MIPDTVDRVRLPLTSVASDVRASARENSRRSLYFFLTAVVGVKQVDVETCSALQKIPLRSLMRLAFGLRLWTLIRGVAPDETLENSEAIRWLFPEKVK